MKIMNKLLYVNKHDTASKLYSPAKAIVLMKERAVAKFIETAEAHISLNLNPKYPDQQLRASVNLPKGLGKLVKVAVIAQGEKILQAMEAGAFVAGSDDLVDAIASGQLNFDKLVATPDAMPLIAKLGRILGPRGLMPSPKAGTVTLDISTAISDFKKGKLQYKLDKTGVIHVPFGKVNFSSDDLLLNFQALLESIKKNSPSGTRGNLWKSTYICSTMGPSFAIDIMYTYRNQLSS
uniref:Ribosomal protein n=1 Tax=Apophlaea sinclairii TaxID=212746 RepID=A0A1C9CBR5_9FLOR|nr:ribosomal protein L1 [Apophlaea sinclairii]AOM65822.1 ribosomal protein L1 [Apophlaea sinclairii]